MCLWVTLSHPEFTLPTWNEEKCSLGLYCCIVSWWVRGLLRPVFLRLCWETQQLFRHWHVLMCQPGGVRISVKPLWGPCIPLCYWLLPNEKVVKECCCWVKCVACEQSVLKSLLVSGAGIPVVSFRRKREKYGSSRGFFFFLCSLAELRCVSVRCFFHRTSFELLVCRLLNGQSSELLKGFDKSVNSFHGSNNGSWLFLLPFS